MELVAAVNPGVDVSDLGDVHDLLAIGSKKMACRQALFNLSNGSQ